MLNKDEIIRMAQQVQDEGFAPVGIWPEVRRLCELAFAAGTAHEREACAKVCDGLQHWAASCCAKDIRARSEK